MIDENGKASFKPEDLEALWSRAHEVCRDLRLGKNERPVDLSRLTERKSTFYGHTSVLARAFSLASASHSEFPRHRVFESPYLFKGHSEAVDEVIGMSNYPYVSFIPDSRKLKISLLRLNKGHYLVIPNNPL